MRQFAIAVTLVAALAGVAQAADTVFLKDGKILQGQILSESDDEIQLDVQGKTQTIKQANVNRVVREPGGDRLGAPEPTNALLSWVDVCIQHLGVDDAGVRLGAVSALKAAGPAARPKLELAAKSSDATVAEIAKRILNSADRRASAGERGQGASRHGTRGPARAVKESLTDSLNLSADQEPKVTEILNKQRDQQRQITQQLKNGELDRDKAREQLAKLRDQIDGELGKVLSEDQMEAYRGTARR